MNTTLAWTLVFHMVGMVFWIGGLLMVTQVLAQDSAAQDASAHSANFTSASKTMNALAHPGAAIMIVTGIILLFLEPSALHAGWLHLKLAFVLGLIALDALLYSAVRQLPVRPARRGNAGMMHGLISAVFFVILVLVFIKPL